MEEKTKKFLTWFFIYAIAFSSLTILFDYFVYHKLTLLKNALAGLIFGIAMSSWKIRNEIKNKN